MADDTTSIGPYSSTYIINTRFLKTYFDNKVSRQCDLWRLPVNGCHCHVRSNPGHDDQKYLFQILMRVYKSVSSYTVLLNFRDYYLSTPLVEIK